MGTNNEIRELNNSVNVPEVKRVSSIKQKIKSYKQQQLTIKAALDNPDRISNNKIVFNDDCHNSDLNEITPKNDKKRILFESDDEEEKNFNFDVKDEFNSEEGRKLLELQSKFKGDNRFALDERFIENRKESNNANCNVNRSECEDISLEEEKKNQIGILEQVLGSKIKSTDTSVQPKSSHEKKMLRFDPTQSNHTQYEITNTEANKKKKQKIEQKLDKNTEIEQQPPQVSKEIFYKVNENLKDVFKSKQEFSLLNLFNNKAVTENKNEDQEQAVEIKNKDQLLLGSNPFHYDSSSEEELEQEAKTENENPQPVFEFITERFFFKDDDFRYQEGSDFVKRIASEKHDDEFVQQRQNLKHIVKSKVRNNQRKNNPFRKKLGGSKKRKVLRIKKALKR